MGTAKALAVLAQAREREGVASAALKEAAEATKLKERKATDALFALLGGRDKGQAFVLRDSAEALYVVRRIGGEYEAIRAEVIDIT